MWLALALLSLVVPPLLGVLLAGEPLAPYLEFAARAPSAAASSYSPLVFAALAAVVVAGVAPLVVVGLCRQPRCVQAPPLRPLPWWGWMGIVLIGITWPLAWTRLEWFEPLQRHTFTPLWLGYILTVNALLYRRAGWSFVTHHRGFLAASFFASIAYWWYFEFANRFVRNWYYVGVESLSTLQYVLFASLSFATVLPAVTGTWAWLGTFERLTLPFIGLARARVSRPRLAGVLLWISALAGLTGIARWPDALYPLVWLAPLAVLTGVRAAFGLPTVFAPLAGGDYRALVLAPLAALLCGFWWELWNVRSLAHWQYDIPWVDTLRLFEMPALGYAGYLPFGLECLAIVMLLPGARRALAAAQRTPRAGGRAQV